MVIQSSIHIDRMPFGILFCFWSISALPFPFQPWSVAENMTNCVCLKRFFGIWLVFAVKQSLLQTWFYIVMSFSIFYWNHSWIRAPWLSVSVSSFVRLLQSSRKKRPVLSWSPSWMVPASFPVHFQTTWSHHEYHSHPWRFQSRRSQRSSVPRKLFQ